MIRFFVVSMDEFFVTMIFSPMPSTIALSAVDARNTSACEECLIAFSLFSSLYSNFWYSILSYPRLPKYLLIYSFCNSLILIFSSFILLLTFIGPSSLMYLFISPKMYGTAYVESRTSKLVSNLCIAFINPILPI